jgi:hypothetical protein
MKSSRLTACVVAAAAILWISEAKPEVPGDASAPADSMRGKEAGEIRDDNGLKMKLVWCSPGFVKMENVELITEPVSEKEVKPNDDDEFDPKDVPAPTPRQTTKVTQVKAFVTRGYLDREIRSHAARMVARNGKRTVERPRDDHCGPFRPTEGRCRLSRDIRDMERRDGVLRQAD